MTTTEVAALLVPAAAMFATGWAMANWKLSLQEKRKADEYARKEQIYKDIVVGLAALYKVDNAVEKESVS